jgi:hypothetical protein
MNMKLLNTCAAMALMAVLVTACGGSENGGDKVKTEIPAELSGNQKVKDYFETLDLVIDEYVTMVEKIVSSGQNAEKKDEEPSFADAMNMVSGIASSTLKMAPLLEKMEKLEKDAEIMKEDMTPEEVEAFSQTYAKMIKRFSEMSKKFEANK